MFVLELGMCEILRLPWGGVLKTSAAVCWVGLCLQIKDFYLWGESGNFQHYFFVKRVLTVLLVSNVPLFILVSIDVFISSSWLLSACPMTERHFFLLFCEEYCDCFIGFKCCHSLLKVALNVYWWCLHLYFGILKWFFLGNSATGFLLPYDSSAS